MIINKPSYRKYDGHKWKELLISHHRCTLLIVDDEFHITEIIRKELRDFFPCVTFTNALDCLKAIEKETLSHHDGYFKDIIKTRPDGTETLHLHNLQYKTYLPNRFNVYGILSADRVMAEKDGLELCKEVSSTPLALALYTGLAKLSECLKAKQDGVIDDFIEKSSIESISKLKNTILSLQNTFFDKLNKPILSLLVDELGENHYQFSDEYKLFVKGYFDKLGASEAYAIDKHGSRLFLTTSGKPSALIVRSEDDIKEILQIINDSGENFPKESFEDIKSGRKILYTGTENYTDVPVNQWPNFLFDASKYDGYVEKLWYAIIEDNIPGLDNSKIVSFDDYMKDYNSKR